MGRLGASNVNVNVNVAAGALQGGAGVPVRFNSQEFRKLMAGTQFPSVSAQGESEFADSQKAVNAVKFRRYWDAEHRAYVFLNEFIWRNNDWLAELIKATAASHRQLHDEKGDQLRQVIEASGDREERFAEIIDQHEGEGAIKYWLGMLMIDPGSAPATYQLIRVARKIGEMAVMCLKHYYREARPSQVCPAIVPMIDPPVTPSFPAGHALQSHLISTCLAATDRPRDQRDLLFGLSERVAENRVIAGLHYPLDSKAGVVAAEECFRRLEAGEKFKELLAEATVEAQQKPQPESGTRQ